MGTSHSLVDQRRETWVLAAHRMSRERAIIVITSPSRSPSTSLAAQGAFPGLASPTSTASEPSRRPNCGDQRDAEKGAKAKLSLFLREKEKESISPLLSLDLLLNLLVLSLSLSLSLRPTGIPKFYRWLSERYPLVNQPVLGTHVPEVDALYLDMNGIIHNCTHGNDPSSKMTETEMILRIFQYLDKLFSIVQPQKLLFMAVDGERTCFLFCFLKKEGEKEKESLEKRKKKLTPFSSTLSLSLSLSQNSTQASPRAPR